MTRPDPAPATGGADVLVTSGPADPAAEGRPLSDADDGDADRPGDSAGVPPQLFVATATLSTRNSA